MCVRLLRRRRSSSSCVHPSPIFAFFNGRLHLLPTRRYRLCTYIFVHVHICITNVHSALPNERDGTRTRFVAKSRGVKLHQYSRLTLPTLLADESFLRRTSRVSVPVHLFYPFALHSTHRSFLHHRLYHARSFSYIYVLYRTLFLHCTRIYPIFFKRPYLYTFLSIFFFLFLFNAIQSRERQNDVKRMSKAGKKNIYIRARRKTRDDDDERKKGGGELSFRV